MSLTCLKIKNKKDWECSPMWKPSFQSPVHQKIKEEKPNLLNDKTEKNISKDVSSGIVCAQIFFIFWSNTENLLYAEETSMKKKIKAPTESSEVHSEASVYRKPLYSKKYSLCPFSQNCTSECFSPYSVLRILALLVLCFGSTQQRNLRAL